MIPVHASDLDDLVAEAERQAGEVRGLLGTLPEEAARWRADETRWSVTGHVAHLAVLNAAYLAVLERTVERASDRGPRGDGPYRHPAVARWFTRSMEPPPKRRMRTFRSMVPDPEATPATALEDFETLQSRMVELMARSRGLDLGRVRFRSPFFALLRFSIGCGFEMLLAHNRRHLWLMREVLAAPGFPSARPGDGRDPAPA